MAQNIPQKSIRLIPRTSSELDRSRGTVGDIAYDKTNNVLRIFDGNTLGGVGLGGVTTEEVQDIAASLFTTATHNHITVSYQDGANKLSLSGFSGDYTDLSNKPTLFDGNYNNLTNKPTLFDGDYNSLTNKPTSFDGNYSSLTGAPTLASVATSGSYTDLTDKPSIPSLTGYATESYVGTQISNLIGTAGAALNTLGELSDALADDANFASTITTALAAKAPLDNPTFTGTVSGITKAMVGLQNVTNESKAVMFTNPVFTDGSTVHTRVLGGGALEVAQSGITLGTVDSTSGLRLSWRDSHGVQGYIDGIGTTILSPQATGDNGLGIHLDYDGGNNYYAMTITQDKGFVFYRASVELMAPNIFASDVTIHDLKTSAGVFYHSNMAGNITANFTNVPLGILGTITVAVILEQGATPYMVNAVQINGSAQTVRWQGGSVPTGTANGVNVVSFTFIRTGNVMPPFGNPANGTWTVLGASGTYS